MKTENPVVLSPEVAEAKAAGRAIVALESTVISHGLPWPDNLKLAQELETIVRQHGAVPATIAIIEGHVKAGLSPHEMERLATGDTHVRKVSRRDFGSVIARREYGATTVAGTMLVAYMAGIHIFATGGIGG
ncbi:MAG: pseudouridine-5'-phosphate glycosidase, partial [Anaerolineae bacterium]